MQHACLAFHKTFPNVVSTGFTTHPNYKLLGGFTSWFYLVRPIFWTWVFARMARWCSKMVVNWYNGQNEEHYYWYYDNLYPDFINDPDDNRYINFRYSDNPVSQEQMTGYYPYMGLKYDNFLNKKYENDG